MWTKHQRDAPPPRLAPRRLEPNAAAFLEQRRNVGLEPRVVAPDQPDALAFLEVEGFPGERHRLGLRQDPRLLPRQHPRDLGDVRLKDRAGRCHQAA